MSRAPFLLDTCAALWAAEASLSEEAASALAASYGEGQSALVSPITAWEIGLLAARGRFRSSYAPQKWFEMFLATPGVALAELGIAALIASSWLPGSPPRDPADRIIIATARELDLIVLTRDRAILDYAEEGHVRAMAC